MNIRLKAVCFVFLLITAVFIAFAYTEIESEKSPKSHKKYKNIIFFIGDGMGLSQITAACIANGNHLNLERFPVIGLIKTPSSNNIITDSAAGATAFSTGKKTNNGAIGVDKNGAPLKTIIELAEENNITTGIVVNCTVTHATPAAFYGHQPTRSNINEQLASAFVKSNIDVLIGGGKKYFTERTDKINLLDSLRKRGYAVIDSMAQASVIHQGQLVCLLAAEQPASLLNGRDSYLPQATAKAIELLKNNENGFFLMVEGSQIDWGGHENNSEYIIKETIEFDQALAEALKFAQQDSNTLIVVTADHETGGFSINGGNLENKSVQGAFTTDYHTATMIPVFSYGAGAELFSGIYENTEIFYKFLSVWGMEEK
jgi:alkaline phosphatase